MTSQFSPKVSEILAFSKEEANRLASSYVGPEHIFLGILREKNGPVIELLNHCNINIQDVKNILEQGLRQDEQQSASVTHDLMLNANASNILKLAVLEARIQRQQTVDVQHLLLAMLHDQMNNKVKDVLGTLDLNYSKAKQELQLQAPLNELNTSEDEDDFEEFPFSEDENTAQQNTKTKTHTENAKTPILDKFSIDLTQAALEGKLDPVVGREKEIQRVIEILCRRKKNNPILIGEPGVGKSAIVEGLAQLIAKRMTSPILFNKKVLSLDMTAIVAGTKYRGQFEERVRALLNELEQNPDIIIFIDEIHTLIGAGSAPGSMDAANIMKPALARGRIQCIGATTINEYRKSIEKDGALERRFQKVLIEPTNSDETLEILNNIKARYEEHHHVTYTDDALKACVRLTERYITDRFFPDKAIDAMDEVGSKVHLIHAVVPQEITDMEKQIKEVKIQKQEAVESQNFELAVGYRDRQTQLEKQLEEMHRNWQKGELGSRELITEHQVAEVVSMMTGVPVQRMAEAEGIRLRNMASLLKEKVIGQDQAITKMVKAIQRNRVGIKAHNRPIGAFMFLGPTGVGKTYLTKKLAEIMFGSPDALIRIDMSEYTESFNSSRLIGAPPGYVGYEEGGQLTEQVRRHPYSIVLLDEIEKAHGNIFNLLLQALDEGRLTDGNGRTIDFRNTIIIMTSNAGTRQLKEFSHGVGFNAGGISNTSNMSEADKEYARSVIQKSLSKQFSPEFLNRLDEIITFDQLDQEAIKKIIDIELTELYQRMEQLGYHVEITDAAKDYVATKGYDVQFGARPLKRAIQNYIEDGLCERILSEEIKEGDTILIDKDSEKEALTFK